MLLLKDIRKWFRKPDGSPLPILDIPQFSVAAGEQMVLVGRSGGGKSTLLHIIAGISRPDDGQGRIVIDGIDIARLSRGALATAFARRSWATAILVRLNDPTVGLTLPRSINKGPIAQAVMPIMEIRNLLDGLIGNLQLILLVLSLLIIVVVGVGILVSIYNSMADRRREIAVMRALGAGRGTIGAPILLESVLLSVLGGVAGFLLGHGLIGLSARSLPITPAWSSARCTSFRPSFTVFPA